MENTSKDSEFKIQLSIKDINKIDEELRGIDNSSKPLEKSNEEKPINIDESQSTVKGLKLHNVCTNCENKFIPKNSMMNEKLCKSCLEK